MRPEYQCSLAGSHRGSIVTTTSCPTTRNANSAVQTDRITKLYNMICQALFRPGLEEAARTYLGSPSPLWAMMLRWISEVPAAIVDDVDVR